MSDDLLTTLDRSVAARQAAGTSPPAIRVTPRALSAPGVAAREPRALRDRYPLVEIFVAAQFLWGVPLFLPGAQALRAPLRALPYAISIALLLAYGLKRLTGVRRPPYTEWLIGVIALLAANLLHSTTHLIAGPAHLALQLSIVAPVFWAWKAMDSAQGLERALRLTLWINAAGAALGVLQVYYPDRFLPPEFNLQAQGMNSLWLDSLTYVGADGRRIIRPPGLTDLPGGAAVAGGLAAILGFWWMLLRRDPIGRAMGLASAFLGFTVIYLTQVRSLFLMTLVSVAVIAAVMARRGKLGLTAGVVMVAAGLTFMSYSWATSVGGDSVRDRFAGIQGKGAVESYRENRGHFLAYTYQELLDEYPFGAGLGRWGMMNVYFADPDDPKSRPLWVEIQPTGWLLDGGIPMWLLYGGGIAMALFASWRIARRRWSSLTADVAMAALALQVFVVGMAFSGPSFNGQLGILFWFLASSLHGVLVSERAGAAR
jgi:energy-converting hydrogenase Eha subunit E